MKPLLRLAACSTFCWFGLNCACVSAAAFELSISGYAERDPQHRELGAWIAIRVPFERLAYSPVRASDEPLDALPLAEGFELEPGLHGEASFDGLIGPVPSATETLELTQLSEPDARSGNTAQPEPGSPPVELAQPASPGAAVGPRSPSTVKATSEPWHLSPPQLRGLVAAVLAQHAERIARLSGLSDRARSSAWLPELKFRAGRNSDQTLRLTPTTDDPDRWALSGGSGFRLEGEVRWQFDRVVFASEEVPIERMRLVFEQQRQKGILEVLDWVFRWQIAMMRRSDPEASPSDRLQAVLSAEQTAAALDVLSGGWFTAHVPGASTSASER